MSQSFRILGKPLSSYVGTLCRQQTSNNFIRSVSNSCLCGSYTPLQYPKYSASSLTQNVNILLPALSTSTRSFSTSQIRFKDPDKKDHGDLIYLGNLTGQVKGLKIFSISTSAIGLTVQPMVLSAFIEKFGIGATCGIFGMLGFFTLVTPILVHLITRKYIAELYLDRKTQTYKAITFTFFLGRDELTFKQEELTKPEMLGILESFRVRGRSLFLDPGQFGDPAEYVKLMGYDKPMDFSFIEDDDKSKRK